MPYSRFHAHVLSANAPEKGDREGEKSTPHGSLKALFLTYRRGGAVVVSPFLNDPLFSLSPESFPSSVQNNPFQIFGSVQAGFAAALSSTTTAEQLSNMYNACLGLWQAADSSVRTLCVGVGPGSFTGLRLGCAFANGLAMAHDRELIALPCPVSGQPESEFSHFVSFDDIFGALSFLRTGKGKVVQTFVPAYGSEPGPVLKLRAEQAAALKHS